mmetsp:Transcript_106256/g.298865  ORF Transcript_106256/g.298865 Transcript_106256/m.298865 type:complete len:458 (+) Transcript_106256:144-1517(+)
MHTHPGMASHEALAAFGGAHVKAAAFEREHFYNTVEENLRYTWNTMLAKDNHYTLFRSEDGPAWLTFTCVFLFLIVFDNAILSRQCRSLTIGRAVLYVLFWVACACGFCALVYWWRGADQAFMWASGYMLEWMLSFDNLFVFHMIFTVYATPNHLKQKPLYLGICGAVVLRLALILAGEYLMHAMFFMHVLFGLFLVYTGLRTAFTDDDDDDPSNQPLVQWLQGKVPFVSAYDEHGALFVRVAVDEHGKALLPASCCGGIGAHGGEDVEASSELRYGTIDFVAARKAQMTLGSGVRGEAAPLQWRGRSQLRATMLVLVVLCLEVSDVIFAVDSVSAIVAQVNDLFLAYTSAVFAMLGLRATFFIIDVLVNMFSLLKYGVSAVLVFIGIKLMLGRLFHISPFVVCAMLLTVISTSMIASVVKDRMQANAEAKNRSDTPEDAPPVSSPVPAARLVPSSA